MKDVQVKDSATVSTGKAKTLKSVEVMYMIDNTVCTDKYTADHVSCQTWEGGMCRIKLTNGFDSDGNSVEAIHYTNSYRAIVRILP